MATVELTYLLLGILILVFLIDILINKRRKSKDTEIEKIEINEKVKKGFWKNFFEKQTKIFPWFYLVYLLCLIIGFVTNERYYERFPYNSDDWLMPLTLIITINILFYFIKTLKKNNYSFKTIKTSLIATLFLLSSLLSLKSIYEYEFYDKLLIQTFYWKTKNFDLNWYTPTCTNEDKSSAKDIIKIKFDNGKLFYSLSRHSNSNGIDDITKINCSYNAKNLKDYIFLDEDGFQLAQFKPEKLTLRTGKKEYGDNNWPRDTKYGKYYSGKGNFYISKKTFKKINKVQILW